MSYDGSQQRLIDSIDGFVVADAGPGTGKTHTVIGRSVEILRRCIADGERMAMLTFTRNAAAEMEKRLVGTIQSMRQEGEIDDDTFASLSRAARTSFIGTFDSFCLNVVQREPWEASAFFGFRTTLSSGVQISESETLNRMYFRRFLGRWLEAYGGDGIYGDIPAILSAGADGLYELINRLMCMGIVPLKHGGWFGGTPRGESNEEGPAGEPVELRGSPSLLEVFINDLVSDKRELAKKLNKCADSMLVDGIEVETAGPAEAHEAAFQDRTSLVRTVHDIFYAYMERCVEDGHLTFGLTACFAFVILYRSAEVRKEVAFDYLTVDEFQDTNGLQMMIAMMVLRKPNLCVVGDWRQGIYGFRYVSIDNILNFEGRLNELYRLLTDDGVERVAYKVSGQKVTVLPLDTSYRSSTEVIHNSYLALTLNATVKNSRPGAFLTQEIVDQRMKGEIVSANDGVLSKHSRVEKVQTGGGKPEEAAEVVRRAFAYVASAQVYDRDVQGFRPARWRDIAVLCRTTRGCREAYKALTEAGAPAFLQGDMEIMDTAEAKILLAWMKYVENITDSRGIVPILGYMGYSAAQIRTMLPRKGSPGTGVPEEILRTRNILLAKTRRISDFIATVYQFHGIGNDISQAVARAVSEAYRRSLMTLSEIIGMIESDIVNNTRYPVDGSPENNAVTVQTVHGSKGLEYPIVIIPFVDANSFPASSVDKEAFRYSILSGVRCLRTVVRAPGGYMEDTGCWRARMAVSSVPPEYDEERRLLFVAISRAKQYVTLVQGMTPSAFFKNLGCRESDPLPEELPEVPVSAYETIAPPAVAVMHKARPTAMPVHQIMGSAVTDLAEEQGGTGRGMNYGSRVHRMAQMLANGSEPDPKTVKEMPETESVRRFLRTRPEGAVYTEVPCALHLDTAARKFVLNGSIDLLIVSEDKVHIYDWKTDVTTAYSSEYRIQLSVYAHAVKRYYPDREVQASIVWLSTPDQAVERISPLSEEEIASLAERSLRTGTSG